jgi:hypothetical protein
MWKKLNILKFTRKMERKVEYFLYGLPFLNKKPTYSLVRQVTIILKSFLFLCIGTISTEKGKIIYH